MSLPDQSEHPDQSDQLVSPSGEPDDPVYVYVAKMDRPGRFQKSWTIQQYSDEDAVAFVKAGTAPGGGWYGWTCVRLIKVNYPEPNTLVPYP